MAETNATTATNAIFASGTTNASPTTNATAVGAHISNHTGDTDYRAELDKMRADYASLKKAFDEASTSVADYKRKERERMSDDEKKAATEAEREAYYKGLERRIAMSDYSVELDDVTDANVRSNIVELFADGKIVEALKAFKEFRVKDRTQLEKRIKDDLMKQNPSATAQSGTGAVKTKEDIMSIKDPTERQNAIKANIHLFV